MATERNEATPTRRTTIESLPPEMQRSVSLPQFLAFGEANYAVENATVQTFQVGSETDGAILLGGAERKIDQKWSAMGGAGVLQQATENSYRTDIQLRLTEVPSGKKVFLSASVKKAITFSVQANDGLSVTFAAGFEPRDSPGSPSFPWRPILIRNCETNQHVTIGRIPELNAARMMRHGGPLPWLHNETGLWIGFIAIAIICFMIWANDFIAWIVVCLTLALAYTLTVKINRRAKRKWDEEKRKWDDDLRRAQSLAEQCPLPVDQRAGSMGGEVK